jgi:Pyruvate/2-oxoacid:ferredoxin oxidoreductase gamma subunit
VTPRLTQRAHENASMSDSHTERQRNNPGRTMMNANRISMPTNGSLTGIGAAPDALAPAAAVGLAIYGLGGLGVVGLSRNMALALQTKYARVASTETRGIAQRRAPVRALVRAGAQIRTAAAPDTQVDTIVALESSEALRAAPLMLRGRTCLLADLRIAPSGLSPARVKAIPDAMAIAAMLRQLGVTVHLLPVSDWLAEQHFDDTLTSAIAFGALAPMLRLNTRACEAILLSRLQGKTREQNAAAFAYGVACFAAADLISNVSAHRGETAIETIVDAVSPLPAIATTATIAAAA